MRPAKRVPNLQQQQHQRLVHDMLMYAAPPPLQGSRRLLVRAVQQAKQQSVPLMRMRLIRGPAAAIVAPGRPTTNTLCRGCELY
jgi:hypothetical protein